MSEVSRIFMFGFDTPVLEGEHLEFFRRIKAKNFILFKKNLTRLEENIEIIKNEFRNPIIAIDQEGGIVRRLKETESFMFGNMNAAMSDNEKYVEKLFAKTGQILREKGFNLNLAPVIDVYLKAGNHIGIRSFGSNEKKVAALSVSAIKGLHKTGVMTTVKHFIGYGGALKDPHKGLPVFISGEDGLRKALYPFEKTAKYTDFIMSAHIIVKELDREMPVTFSKNALTFLRVKTGFIGPIISDCLEMGGAAIFPPGETALNALQAGNDMLIVSHTLSVQKEMFKAIEKRGGKDTERAIMHIESLKKRKFAESKTGALEKYVTVVKDSGFIPQNDFHFLHPNVTEEVQVEEMGKIVGNFPLDANGSDVEKFASFENERAVMEVYNAFRHKGQIALAKKIKQKGKKLCVIVAGDPADIPLFRFADCIVTTLSPLSGIMEYALKVVKGKEKFGGILPVSEEIWK